MSTQRFMSRICKSPGRFAFAILLGAVLALPCLLPAAVFASTSGQAETLSRSSLPTDLAPSSSVLTKVGVSVVRVVAMYGAAGTSVTCTGLGVLVASMAPAVPSKYYTNWVVADGNLVSTKMTTCGKLGDSLPLNDLQVWTSNEYSNGETAELGHLTCTNAPGTCNDALPSSALDQIMLPPPQNSSASFYTLFSFQSVAGEPFVNLATPTEATATPQQDIINVGLTQLEASKGSVVYPYKSVATSNIPPANFKDYLTPAIVGDPAGAATSANGSTDHLGGQTNTIEGGTPEFNGQGQLLGMWVNNGAAGYNVLSTGELQTAWAANKLPLAPLSIASLQACTVAACWNTGIDAYSAANYTAAHANLSKVSELNPQFSAAQHFANLAQQQLKQPSPVPSSQGANLLTQWPILVAVGLLILVLIVVALVLAVRIRKRRRALAEFEAEVKESQRIVSEQTAQRQHAQKPANTQVPCPNCHNLVYLTDGMCPFCRFPLSPTASGMGVRLVGNAPLAPTAPMPPSAPALISEQPTVLFPPSPAASVGEPGEPTLKRQQLQAHEEPTQEIHQWRAHNLSLAVGTRSDPGIKRKHKPNEDSLFAMQGARTHNSQPQQFGLFVVADGMGGHANGQDASRLAIQTMIDFMLPRVSSSEQMDDEAFLKLMTDGVQNSNQAVHNRNVEAHADMGTTMTAALAVGSVAYVANVGDSRTYLYREGQGLSKVTHDHSVVASLVEAGIIKPDDIYTHPKRNQIYRSLGEKPVVEVDTFKVNLLPGDKLMLCSDGLWDMVRDPLIQEVLSKATRDPNKTGQALIKAALEGGGEDNVSVIVAQFAEMSESTSMTGVQLLAKPESVTVPNLPPL